jgi:membrane protein
MWNKVVDRAKLTYQVFLAAAKEFGNDRGSRMASSIAYRVMFALAPMFLLAVSILGIFLGSNEAAQLEIYQRVAELAGTDVADALRTFLVSVEVSGSTAAIVGTILLFWTSSSLFIEIQGNLNDIFHVPQERVSGVMGFIRKRTLGFLWVIGVGLALIAIWLLNAMWRFFGDEILPPGADRVHFFVGLLTPIVSVILLPLLLGLFFQTMSAVKVRWRAIWWGSFFTSVSFLAAAYGAGLYFSWDSDTSASQVAASIFVILLLAFVLASVFIFGAEVTKVYHDYLMRGRVALPGDRPVEISEPVVAEPPSLGTSTLVAFLAGLAVGWRRRR